MGKPIPPHATLRFDIDFLTFDLPESIDSFEMSNEEKLKYVQRKREEGNALFQANRYFAAYRRYIQVSLFVVLMSLAIDLLEGEEDLPQELKPNLMPLYLNVSASSLKLENWKEAIAFASKALAIDPQNPKGLFRRGKAHTALKDWDEAVEDLRAANAIDPSNTQIKKELAFAREKQLVSKKKEQQFYGGIFSKLEAQKNEKELYPEPTTKTCTICKEEVETIQWARHVIKKHGKMK